MIQKIEASITKEQAHSLYNHRLINGRYYFNTSTEYQRTNNIVYKLTRNTVAKTKHHEMICELSEWFDPELGNQLTITFNEKNVAHNALVKNALNVLISIGVNDIHVQTAKHSYRNVKPYLALQMHEEFSTPSRQ